jgi:hypothetical protein
MATNRISFPAHRLVSPEIRNSDRDEILARWRMKGDQRLLPVIEAIRSGKAELDDDDFRTLTIDGYQIAIRSNGPSDKHTDFYIFEVRIAGLEVEAWGSPLTGFSVMADFTDKHLGRAVRTALRAVFVADLSEHMSCSEGDDVEGWA